MFSSSHKIAGLVCYAFRNDTCNLLIKVSPAVPWQRLQHPQLLARSWHLQNCWAMNLVVKLALIAWRNIWLPQALHSRNPVDIDLLTCWDHAWSSVVGVLACFRCIFVRPGRNLSYRLYNNTVYIYILYINYIYFIIIYIIYNNNSNNINNTINNNNDIYIDTYIHTYTVHRKLYGCKWPTYYGPMVDVCQHPLSSLAPIWPASIKPRQYINVQESQHMLGNAIFHRVYKTMHRPQGWPFAHKQNI